MPLILRTSNRTLNGSEMAQMAHLSKHAKSSAGFIVCLFLGVCGKKGNERYAFKAVTKDGRSLSGNIFDRDHKRPYENLIKILDTRFRSRQKITFTSSRFSRMTLCLPVCYIPSGMRLTGNSQNLFGIFRETCQVYLFTAP